MSNFIDYLKETKEEISHVAWPTTRQAVTYTALVVGVSIAVALLLSVFDYIISLGLNWFIQ